MSNPRRNSNVQANTMLNYFLKSPPPVNKNVTEEGKKQGSSLKKGSGEMKPEIKKRERQVAHSSDNGDRSSNSEEEVASKKFKRVRVLSSDSDSMDEVITKAKVLEDKISLSKMLNDRYKYEPGQSSRKDTESVRNQTPGAEVGEPSSSEPEPVEPQPVVTAPAAAAPRVEATVSEIADAEGAEMPDEGNWTHCQLEWLKPHRIMDINRKKPDDPDYDPSTLHVPAAFIQKQTPAHRQWWEMKATHYDCVLFFKVGKFYELYHMDAAVGVNELGFSYMKGDFAHSGFPESAYGRMAATLVSKGYKVARVEQTETPDMMQERCKKAAKRSKEAKVVRREICQVTSLGTQVCTAQDPGPAEASSNYLLSITEEEGQSCSQYGVCFIDTSIGVFHLGQFQDDEHSSRLLTTLAHHPPALIVFDRKTVSQRTRTLLVAYCGDARRDAVSMWPPEKTLKTLSENYYKTDGDGDWPEGLKPFLHEGEALGLTPAAGRALAVRALGGCVAQLAACLIDIQVLGMAQFAPYAPPDVLNQTLSQGDKGDRKWTGGRSMVLDAITLKNLRIVQEEGCLYDKLNFCTTAMGKRLLYQWVCAPSCVVEVIRERQEAVKFLFENQELHQDAKNLMSKLPDLERLLAKVHTFGNHLRSKNHPDARAIFYEEKIYSKNSVLDFVTLLNGLNDALKLGSLFSEADAALLKKLTQPPPLGTFPDIAGTLELFKDSFDAAEAQKGGRIVPREGVDDVYDGVLQAIAELKDEIADYLKEQERHFRCRLTFVGTDRKRYQIEVPQSAVAKAGPSYNLEGSRKGFKRFSTAETKEFVARMVAAEEQRTSALKDINRRVFERFSGHYEQWAAAGARAATLDVLLALAEFARQQTRDICIPEVTCDNNKKPYINIVGGRHPCIPIAEDYIPNDTALGGDEGSLLLLSGPNMGGKSTLMRQTGLLTVLAQLGSYVPAERCGLSLADRVFTRLGACDDIVAGQSTFLVEMREASAILAHATEQSLVLIDELGRGTSTGDGAAIAQGACAALAARGCRVLFATHYHALARLASHPAVLLGHMACLVEAEGSEAPDKIPEEKITFLYKLSGGACPESHGFHAARLAGVAAPIVRRARRFARGAALAQAFAEVLAATDADLVQQSLNSVAVFTQ